MKDAGGWLVWAAMLALAWTLPGRIWKPQAPPLFPWRALLPFLALLAALALLVPALVALGGRRLARLRILSVLEAPPTLLWGILLLALWPAAFGPPGWTAWALAFLLCAVPMEVRWLAQALPAEQPFPEAWGAQVRDRSRRATLCTLVPRWLAARLPVWITATLVLERLLGVAGPGGDWVARIAVRDRVGIAIWVGVLALLWSVARPLERTRP